VPANSNAPLPPEAKGLLDTIAGTEAAKSGDPYTGLYGGGHKVLAPGEASPAIPIRSGPNAGLTSSAYGRYQFINPTWQTEASKLGLKDRSPANQDRAAWDLAETTYRQKTKRDLLTDIRAGKMAEVGAALHSQWTSLPGGIEQGRGNTEAAFQARFAANIERHTAMAANAPPAPAPARAEGAPAQVTGGPPVSGSVDVTITHKNAPAGSFVTASAAGDANVSRPRTEQQQLSAA
jgi:muramidase (phage lysozyme)